VHDHRLSNKGATVDALAQEPERDGLTRYALGAVSKPFDPEISEWENPGTLMGVTTL